MLSEAKHLYFSMAIGPEMTSDSSLRCQQANEGSARFQCAAKSILLFAFRRHGLPAKECSAGCQTQHAGSVRSPAAPDADKKKTQFSEGSQNDTMRSLTEFSFVMVDFPR
jgi:hypothetical protein